MKEVELTEDGQLMNTIISILFDRGFNPEDFHFSAIETVKNSKVYTILLVSEYSKKIAEIMKIQVY